MDEEEAKKYNPSSKLPVFIILENGEEKTRFAGEYRYEEFVEKLKELGVIHEENH